MKLISLFVVLLTAAACSHSPVTDQPTAKDRSVASAGPSEQTYRWVYEQGKKLNYDGFDVLACVDTRNNVVIGGISFWSIPLQIFYVDRANKVVGSKKISGDLHDLSKPFDFKLDNGSTLQLMLKDNGDESTVSFNYQESAMIVRCYRRQSGLE